MVKRMQTSGPVARPVCSLEDRRVPERDDASPFKAMTAADNGGCHHSHGLVRFTHKKNISREEGPIVN